MPWSLTDDIASYQTAAGGLLKADPVRNTVLLSILASLARIGPTAFGPEPPLFGWWSPMASGTTRWHRPKQNGEGGGTPDAAARAADHAPAGGVGRRTRPGARRPRHRRCPASTAWKQDATSLARAWHQLTGMASRVSLRQRLYWLAELLRPDHVPDGTARVATPADATVARALYSAFAADVGQDDADPST